MVHVAATTGTFAIDRTEVTQQQYAAFLQACTPELVAQPDVCSWNSSFVPDLSGAVGACDAESYTPESTPNRPVVCVDWCDAHAYCEAVGKHLCGGTDGLPRVGRLLAASPELSTWAVACSSDGAYGFPYGPEYQPTTCVDAPASTGPQDVGTTAGCHGVEPPFSEIFDLSGNVAEWTDECETARGPDDWCMLRGGSYHQANLNEGDLGCGQLGQSNLAVARDTGVNDLFGFRCCAAR